MFDKSTVFLGVRDGKSREMKIVLWVVYQFGLGSGFGGGSIQRVGKRLWLDCRFVRSDRQSVFRG